MVRKWSIVRCQLQQSINLILCLSLHEFTRLLKGAPISLPSCGSSTRCAVPFVEFFHVERKNSISAIPVDKRSYIGGSRPPTKFCVCIPSIQFDKPFGIGIRRTPTELLPDIPSRSLYTFSFIILMFKCQRSRNSEKSPEG